MREKNEFFLPLRFFGASPKDIKKEREKKIANLS